MSLSIENIWPVTVDRAKSNGRESDKAGMSRNRAFIGTIFAAEPNARGFHPDVNSNSRIL